MKTWGGRVDIYTAARRISRFIAIDGAPPEKAGYGAIGEGHTCALVGVNGSVDWLCLPRFDSPSVFGALLDTERGGFFRISPIGHQYESLQAYDDATNVLQTLFRSPGAGSVVLTDLMPWNGDPRSALHEMLRLIEAREGSLEMEVVFDPRFDYGRGATDLSLVDDGVIADIGPVHERSALAVVDMHADAAEAAGRVDHGRDGERIDDRRYRGRDRAVRVRVAVFVVVHPIHFDEDVLAHRAGAHRREIQTVERSIEFLAVFEPVVVAV